MYDLENCKGDSMGGWELFSWGWGNGKQGMV